MVIIFVLLVFVLGQGFLSVALSSRDRALDRLNRQVSELSELLSLERGQAEELRGSLGRLTEDLRAAIAARDGALEGLSALREERDRLLGERDAARGERSRLSARLADLEVSARDGGARIAELEARLAEAQARAEAAGGDTARTVRTLTDAQRLLAAERAALEAVRRDLATARGEVQVLGRDLAGEREALATVQRDLAETRAARDAASQELATRRQQAEALARDLAGERQARGATERELAEARALSAAELAARRRQLEALTAELSAARSALEVARRDLETQTQARAATAQELAEVRALTQRELEARQRAAESLAGELAAARSALEVARRDLDAQTQARAATAQELAEVRALTAQQLEARRQEAEALARELAEARATLQAAQRDLTAAQANATGVARDLAAERAARAATARELAEARATATRDLEDRRREAEALAAQLAEARASLEAARRDVAALRAEAERMDQTVTADRATIQARLSDIARLAAQVRGLEALRDQLERQAEQALARAGDEARQRATAETARQEALTMLEQMTGRATQAERGRDAAAQLAGEAGRRAAEEERRRAAAEAQAGEYGRLSESARVEVARLTQQLESLRAELSRVARALDAAEASERDKDAQIVALGQRLNVALAARVEELQRYRSDFFGRLRQVLGDRPEVRIVGDRFVFQSEVLFPVGSADLSQAGQQQIRDLGHVLLEIARQFPADLGWILRVDGHADRSPIRAGGRFASNWELSSARAIAVARLLIDAGLPSNKVAAVAFGDTQPLDDSDSPDALARNRRIELRLEPAPTGAAPVRPAGELRRILGEVVEGQACARLSVTEAGNAARITGLARRGTEAALRSALQARGAPAAGIELRGFDGPYCEVIEALRQVPPAAGPAAARLDLVGRAPLVRGTPLRLDLGLPDWGGQVALHYLSGSGNAYRLEQMPAQQPGARLRLGEPRPGFPGWLADEPFGTDVVLAVVTEGPLFAAPRPAAEPLPAFAAALSAAIETARREGRRVAVQLLPVETVAR
jgi:chemotaxis protein MotB